MSPSRKRKNAVARVRPFSIAIVLIVICAGVGLYYATKWPLFYPRHITVTGTSVVTKEEVVQRAALDPYRNIWLQNIGAAASRIAAIPYVRTVQIRRKLPAFVTIAIEERKPFAIVEDGVTRVVIDDQLHILPIDAALTDLPQLRSQPIEAASVGKRLMSAQLAQLVRDCKALVHASVPVAYMNLDKVGNLNARLRSGIVVEFGDDSDVAAKARLVNPVLSQVAPKGRKVRALDLRAAKTPVLVYVR
ncbi:MAG: FtsQ-type POTRA domain-containing protein [Candidatus Eremiobacteraeota bacterium]|nr:FtsQ-type POTRA domain-containing protein [Candidatus Eremiobacteraeota bacterium]